MKIYLLSGDSFWEMLVIDLPRNSAEDNSIQLSQSSVALAGPVYAIDNI